MSLRRAKIYTCMGVDGDKSTERGDTGRSFMNTCSHNLHLSFTNKWPNSIKRSPTPKALKTHLQRYIASIVRSSIL